MRTTTWSPARPRAFQVDLWIACRLNRSFVNAAWAKLLRTRHGTNGSWLHAWKPQPQKLYEAIVSMDWVIITINFTYTNEACIFNNEPSHLEVENTIFDGGMINLICITCQGFSTTSLVDKLTSNRNWFGSRLQQRHPVQIRLLRLLLQLFRSRLHSFSGAMELSGKLCQHIEWFI